MFGIMIFKIIMGGTVGGGTAAAQSSGTVVNSRNVKKLMKRAYDDQVMPEENYTVTMNYDWLFESGDAVSSNAYVENSADNYYPVKFEVLLGEDEERIYTSTTLQPGDYLDEIKLKKSLAAGTYDCVVIYTLLDERGKDMSSVRVAVTVNIEN